MTALLVALGAVVGAPARFLVARALPGVTATLAVNVAGSALLGALGGASTGTAALVGVGFCGAFTTYSAFAVEAVEARSWRYVVATVVLCVGAAAISRSVAG
ncbi:MAG: CrcB protein [Frankiales bacterium]|nr:CrcB protein [Frankiales bacterium]